MVRVRGRGKEAPVTPVALRQINESPFLSPNHSSTHSTPVKGGLMGGTKRGKRSAAWLMSPSSAHSPKAGSPAAKRAAQFATPKVLAKGTPIGGKRTISANHSPFVTHSPASVLALRRTPHRSNPSSYPSSPIVDYTTANRQLPEQPQTQEQINQTFEEWIKIAADNKINANNTWNLALIDYFSELSLLRDGDSINFQKASCTLDGCIKIYTSRVDSVANETGKLLTGLSDNTKSRRRDDDDDDDEATTGGSTRKRSKAASTIATSAALNLKKFDLEFAVDPLFKKTSADFDEGGAKGLLLNHLGMDAQGKIVFDASDAAFARGQEEQEQDDTLHSFVDLTKLRDKYLPDLRSIENKEICTSLMSFPFFSPDTDPSADNFDVETLMQRVADSMAAIEQEQNGHVIVDESLEDFLHIPSEEPQDFMDDGGFGFSAAGPMDDDMMSDHGGDDAYPMGMPMPTMNQAERGKRAMQQTFIASMADEKDSLFSYFDAKLLRQWAGPEHWKMRPVVGAGKNDGTLQTKQTKKTEKTTLDFLHMAPVDAETLFAKPASAASITLPKTVLAERSQQWHLLPEDLHMTSDTLLRLFMKPEGKTMVQRKQLIPSTHGMAGDDDEDLAGFNDGGMPDETWMTQGGGFENGVFDQESSTAMENPTLPVAEPEADHFEGDDGFGFFGLDDDDDDDMIAPLPAGAVPDTNIPFIASSQPASDHPTLLPGGIELSLDFGNELVQAPRLTKSLKMSYAKRSKKCDVKKLKNTLWQNFQQRLPHPSPHETGFTVPSTVTHFSELVDSVMPHTETVPVPGGADATAIGKPSPNGLKDVSVPFCFICLLHLANENGLVIQGNAGLDELSVAVDEKVREAKMTAAA